MTPPRFVGVTLFVGLVWVWMARVAYGDPGRRDVYGGTTRDGWDPQA